MVKRIQDLWDQVWQYSTTLIYQFLGDRIFASVGENREISQITEAFPWNEAPRYLIRDRDHVYGIAVKRYKQSAPVTSRSRPGLPGKTASPKG